MNDPTRSARRTAATTLHVEAAPTAARLALVATDGSEAAIAAARQSVELLHPDLTVCLVTIIHPEYDPNEDAGGFEGPVMTQRQADEEHEEALANSSGALATTATVMRPGTTTEIVTSEERPADALVSLAQDRHAALLVVGHEQHGILHELFAGSVAERVIRRLTCPVLVIPTPG